VKVPKEVKLNFHKHGIEDNLLKFSMVERGKYKVYFSRTSFFLCEILFSR